MRRNFRHRIGTIAVAALLSALAGCGESLHPVRGKVTLDDGSPLPKGMVIFESVGRSAQQSLSARGEIQPDGTYELSGETPGSGVPAGKYRVLIASTDVPVNAEAAAPPPAFDPKFTSFETSGLEFEVKPGSNEFDIVVPRPGKSGRTK